jgi:uncharacterized membrane protein
MIDSWKIYTLITIFFWGWWGILGKIASQRLNGWSIYLISFIPSLLLIIVSLLMPKLRPMWVWPASGFAILSGIAGLAGTITFYHALTKGPASQVVTLSALYPAFAVILAVVLLKEKLDLAHLIGIILAILAGYLLAK